MELELVSDAGKQKTLQIDDALTKHLRLNKELEDAHVNEEQLKTKLRVEVPARPG